MHLNSCRWQIHPVNHGFLPLLFSLGGFHRPPGLQTVKKRTCITFFSWRNKKKRIHTCYKKKKQWCSDTRIHRTFTQRCRSRGCVKPRGFFSGIEVSPHPAFDWWGCGGMRRRQPILYANKQSGQTAACTRRVQDSNLAARLARQRFPCYRVRTAKHIT